MERILKNITVDSKGCWNWNNSCNSSGYGQLTVNKKYWTAHRYSYTMSKGEIPKDMVVRHKCHNTKCCNPDHLLIGTEKDNWNDSKEVHLKADAKRRKAWMIDGISYKTIREASCKTGMHQSTIIKYTNNGIFDVVSYRKACIVANVEPRV